MLVSVYCDDTELGTGNVRYFLVTVFTLSGRLEMWKCLMLIIAITVILRCSQIMYFKVVHILPNVL